MPTSKSVGTPGARNEKIGGIPEIHYYDFQSRGRGQVLRLLMEDAGIAYKDTRYSFEEMPSFQKGAIGDMNPLGTVPVVELDGQVLTQSYAIMRRWGREMGEYDGVGNEELYWVDSMCDVGLDWRTVFVNAFFCPDSETRYPKYCGTDRTRYMKALEGHLTSSAHAAKGPFVLGERITYADFVIYQVMHDEGLTKDPTGVLSEFPKLTALVESVEARPNVKAYMESDRYLG